MIYTNLDYNKHGYNEVMAIVCIPYPFIQVTDLYMQILDKYYEHASQIH